MGRGLASRFGRGEFAMTITRRAMLEGGLAVGTAALVGLPARSAFADAAWSGGGVRSHGHSLGEPPRYGPGFARFDYVNPDAPKGGRARILGLRRFDSFNPFIVRGDGASNVATMRLIEPLMVSSFDEDSVHYGLIAEWMEEAQDASWVAFKIRDGARFHDGTPITPADAIYSLDIIRTKARPFYGAYYKDVAEATDEGENIVFFRFAGNTNRELAHIMGQLPIFPKHWWETRAFDEPSLEPPLGSGPYRISDHAAGRFIEYERVKDYWGADLPVNVGRNNFDVVRFEYFSDRDAAFEAFKAKKFDFWDENSASRWALQYDFPAAQAGEVKKVEHVTEGPKVVQFFCFNLRRPQFQDRRIREALGLAFDFEYSNRALFYNQYARPRSYFQGTDALMATGLPDAAELALLEPFRDQLPEALFTETFAYPETNGDGVPRRNLRRARRLLTEAGCELVDGKLRRPDGEPFVVEFLIADDRQRVVVDPFLQNMSRVLGVETSIRRVDASQYVRRIQDFDFDLIVSGVANSSSPGNEQRDYWGSATADLVGSRNRSGVKNPVVDALIDAIIAAENRPALKVASRALDRVLLWEHYTVLQLYTPYDRFAHWASVAGPDPLPSRDARFPSVWWSTET